MLSDEQRDIIENSLWVVNTALKKQGLEDEDMKQSAILYMCKCLERFDPSKNIKWTTFAYKNVYLFIKRTHKKQQEKSIPTVSENMFYLADKEDNIEIYDFNDPKGVLEAFKGFCTMDERKCIDLKLQGYKELEISHIMNCSISKIINCIKAIKLKAKDICEELEFQDFLGNGKEFI